MQKNKGHIINTARGFTLIELLVVIAWIVQHFVSVKRVE